MILWQSGLSDEDASIQIGLFDQILGDMQIFLDNANGDKALAFDTMRKAYEQIQYQLETE